MGFSVSISKDARFVSLDSGLSINADHKCNVVAYKYSKSTDRWELFGDVISVATSNKSCSHSVSIFGNEYTLATGGPHIVDNVENSGHIRVFKHLTESNTWEAIDNTIVGVGVDDYFGSSISISEDGKIVAGGALRSHKNGEYSGYVKVFSVQKANLAKEYGRCSDRLGNW